MSLVHIVEDIKSLLVNFADDTVIGGVVNNKEERSLLQRDLNHLVKWSKSYKLCFNTVKYKVIHLGNKNAGNYL